MIHIQFGIYFKCIIKVGNKWLMIHNCYKSITVSIISIKRQNLPWSTFSINTITGNFGWILNDFGISAFFTTITVTANTCSKWIANLSCWAIGVFSRYTMTNGPRHWIFGCCYHLSGSSFKIIISFRSSAFNIFN